MREKEARKTHVPAVSHHKKKDYDLIAVNKGHHRLPIQNKKDYIQFNAEKAKIATKDNNSS